MKIHITANFIIASALSVFLCCPGSLQAREWLLEPEGEREINPTHLGPDRAKLDQAQQTLLGGRPAKASKLFSKWLKKFPNSPHRPEAIYYAGQSLQQQGRLNQAFETYEQLILRYSDSQYFPLALEGALKLKEISYIHAEGYAAGELKHGPFALLSSDTPVVAIAAQDNSYEAMLTNIKEIKARQSPVMALVGEGDDVVSDLADWVITVPQVDPIFSPAVNVVALQLLAYHTAKYRGCPIDFPRNLAKSVTVE